MIGSCIIELRIFIHFKVNMLICKMCGANVPEGFGSCRAVFEAVCAREYSEPGFAAVHLLTVDAYTLQHSEEHGPRSNAFHLMRLGRLLERGEDASLGHRPPREVGKAFEERYRRFPFLEPPRDRGELTVVDVHGVQQPEAYARQVRAWARAVWEAYQAHHDWARRAAAEPGGEG